MQLIDFANLDFDRFKRKNNDEVVYCEHKSVEQVVAIMTRLYEKNKRVLGTRASREMYEALKQELPSIIYDEVSRVLYTPFKDNGYGEIAIVSAGTSDLYAVREAALVAGFLGSKVSVYNDVGISALQRLLGCIEDIRRANVIIVVAGMEGALATAVSGLVSAPVICLPTSVGYGASFNGLSALLTMLNSCSEGSAVVNIDNGFGAACMAHKINIIGRKRDEDTSTYLF